MPYRKTPLVNGEIYHVFNRSVAHQPIFLSDTYYQRGFEALSYYNNLNPPIRFSHFNRLPLTLKNQILKSLNQDNQKLVNIMQSILIPKLKEADLYSNQCLKQSEY